MPRERPQLSITLPRNFTFHYTEGEEPKTPEREILVPVPQSPRARNALRIKRKSRPSVDSVFENIGGPIASSDIPIPTIETPVSIAPTRPLFQQRATEPAEGFLAPVASRKFSTLPRTPEPYQRPATDGRNATRNLDFGESISRPLSACSLLSDSSDDSNGSLISYPAGDGSCTSPESDAPDPFKFSTIRKTKSKQWAAALARNEKAIQSDLPVKKQPPVRWTSDMDKHLWSTYLTYLQDPTVTPFKMLPGVAPPLGVCHRVVREARKTWRGSKSIVGRPSDLLNSPLLGRVSEIGMGKVVDPRRADSPDTIRATRSGSNTPTGSKAAKPQPWPKSGSSTRRRLRYLCKSRPSIAPHYQRLLQSRSPSPFSSSSPRTRSYSRLSEVSSPAQQNSSPFSTRSIQLSLTTSTAASMQPDNPLAQLASGSHASTQSDNEWFNEPPVPWASPTAIPSDVTTGAGAGAEVPDDNLQAPRLGSPFGYHTWGPSRTRQRIRPSTSRIQSTDASTLGPSLRSPIRMHDTFPYPGVQKRRALHQLEDELSPGGSNMQQELLDNLFANSSDNRHRRVRSRGFSLGDVHTNNPLESLFTPPIPSDQLPTPGMSTESPSDATDEPVTPTQVRRLGSPFHGVSPRPNRSRHLATTSLGGYEPFSSIGETLGQRMESGDTQTSLQQD